MEFLNAPALAASRRCFLQQTACGLGSIALSQLLGSGNLAPEASAAGPDAAGSRAINPAPHYAPRAKNVIFLFMGGAPSQLDLFDPKPEMQRLHGEPVPPSFVK